MLDIIWQDIRYAARSMRRTPGFTAAAVITLALGIGANTAAFSVVDAVILRPLLYTNPERLVVIHETLPRLGRFPVGPNEFEEWRRSARSFEQMALLAITPVNLTGAEDPERLDGARIGKRFRLGAAPRRLVEVIGVVGDVRGMGLDADPSLAVYLPYWQGFLSNVSFAIKTSGDVAPIASGIRSAIRTVDAGVPIFALRTMEQIVGDSVAPRRFETMLVTLFAAIAILLSAIGIYGVLSHAVTQRTREMGVRLALGARPTVVHWIVLRDALRLVVAGLVIGVPAAIAVGFMLRTLLFGVEPQNLVTLAWACGLLTAVAMFAAFLPARRAASVDPMIAIRSE